MSVAAGLALFSAAAPSYSQQPTLDAARRARTRQFLAERATADGTQPAKANSTARAAQAALMRHEGLRAHATVSVSAAWQPVGPSSVVSPLYGKLTGRVTSIAFDPNDTSGNTVYLGTTGGGVWKSTSAAGSLAAASFVPLTDTLPVFSLSAGYTTVPSLSIGAVAVQPSANPVVLAGTGDPNDSTDSLYGEGILRSADGGLTWSLITQSYDGANGGRSFAGLATAGFAWSTASPSLVVAAMSSSPQSAIVNATNSYSISGLYYSSDAGVTWRLATVYDGAQIVQQPQLAGTGEIGHPATSVVWDAQRGRFFAALRNHGYYSSADGMTWTRLAQQPGTGLTAANCPSGANGAGSSTCPIFRGALAVQPETGDLYAVTVDSNDNDQGLWQDLCSANASGGCASAAPTWGARLDNGALEVGNGSTAIAQGDYNLSLAALPVAGSGTLLFAGTEDLYRCSLAAGASSCVMRNTTDSLNGCNAPAGVFPAQHAIAGVQLSGSPMVLVGNDGGLWRSMDGVAEAGPPCSATDAQHFDNMNAAIGSGGSLAEVVSFAQDPGSANTLVAGLGELGTSATSNASTLSAWPQLAAGEGGFPLIDPNTPANWTLSIGAGVNLKQCTSGASCSTSDFMPPATVGGPQVSYDAALLDAPSLLDPQQTTNVLVGTCRVWRGPASTGTTWNTSNAASPALDGTAGVCTQSSAMVRSIAAGGPAATSGNAGATVLYAGMAGALDQGGSIAGHVFAMTAANNASSATPWTDVTKSPVTNDARAFNSGGFDISSVTVDAHDATGATVYASIMGFGGVPHLYRSTDFGAHWLRINSNLPNAPANAVVVDPNDANTVYVATDTGVYVTQAVATCGSGNCWTLLGTGLPNAPVTALQAAAQLPTGDGRVGLLRAGTYGRGLWQIPLLTAHSTAQPAITLSATSLSFAAQAVGSQSPAQVVTVTSSGNAPVTFGTPSMTGDFVEADTCAGQTLAVGASCTFSVSFAPTQTGARSGLLNIYSNISGGQATVNLSGSGTAPAAVVLTPASLSFPATVVNHTSATKIITVANTGGTPASVGAITVSGDFAIAANTCATTLPAQTSCSLSITFIPTASGSRTGVLTVTDSVGTQTAQLSGTGQAPATDTLAPLSLSFPQQAVGTSSAAQQVILTNSGDVALTLITTAVAGTDFGATNGCGASLNPHASCAISVVFAPTSVGTRSGTLTVTDQFRSQTVALSGIGIAPAGVSLSPASLTFVATGVGLTALPQTLTLTNNGGLPLNIASTVASSGFVIASSTCSATLMPAAACNLVVVFAPTAAGSISGTLTVADDAPSGQQVVNLGGAGVDFTLTPDGSTTATVSSGSVASYSLLLRSMTGLQGTVALGCSGAPANAVCTVSPGTGSLGGTTVVTVSVQTGQATANARYPQVGAAALLALLAAPLAWGARRRRFVRLFLCMALLAATGALAGCGATRLIPAPGGGGSGTGGASPTPAGTYNLTVSGSAAGLTHSVGLTLVVK